MGGLELAEPSKWREKRRLAAAAPCRRSRVGSSVRGDPEGGVKDELSSVANESCLFHQFRVLALAWGSG